MAINKDFYNPYSFVPLNEQVLYYEKEEVEKFNYAHDIPISDDSLSGIIELSMEAKTPFCIKTETNDSVNIDGKYFIPGTTIKGMIRNVFEIITLSNIKNFIANNRYSMRDLRSRDYELNRKTQKGGFLVKINHEHFIVDCDFDEEIDKYPYDEIQEIEGVNIKQKRTIQKKYETLTDGYIFFNDNFYRMWFFSGFMHNKKHEYLFTIPNNLVDRKLYHINKKEWKDFIFIHEKENENEGWKFWKRKLRNYTSIEDVIQDGYKGIIPCFYRLKNSDSGQTVRDLGFSYLYRQPYSKSTHDFVPEVYDTEKFDMTDILFGYSRLNDSFKGRISFSNTFISNMELDDSQTFIMGKPKPTYYPFYLEQDKHGKLKTYFSDNTVISGWKRNLVHKKASKGISTGKPKVESKFIPIKQGAKFTCKIKFHNLLDYELGALLSAITFHNSTECYHLLGYAKAYGYGKFQVSNVELKHLINSNVNTIDFYVMKFEEFLNLKKIKISSWQKTLNNLKSIASDNYHPEKPIRYPSIDKREFRDIKSSDFNINDFTPE